MSGNRLSIECVEARPFADVPLTLLFGIEFARVGLEDLVASVSLVLKSETGLPMCIFTPNVDQIVRHATNPDFRDAYRTASFAVPDGMPVLWVSKLAGKGLPERITGIDLMLKLCELASREQHSCFFLGASEDVLRDCITNVAIKYPSLRFAGSQHGYFSDDECVCDAIRRTGADILFVAMGSPKQEKWVAKHRSMLGCRLVLPVGGAFDVLAGRKTRAPRLLQAAGLEWCWRLLLEPRRMWKRYLVDDWKFVWLAAREVVRIRTGSSVTFKPSTRREGRTALKQRQS